jgi:hypothetical protein
MILSKNEMAMKIARFFLAFSPALATSRHVQLKRMAPCPGAVDLLMKRQ